MLPAKPVMALARHISHGRRRQCRKGTANRADKGLVVDLSVATAQSGSVDRDTGKPRRSRPRERLHTVELCARCHSRRGQIWDDYRVLASR